MDKMDQIWAKANQENPSDSWTDQESMWSHEYNATRVKPDYFVVGSDNPDGGRIVKMEPLTITFDVIASPPVFKDAMSGEIFPVNMETSDIRV